MRSMTARAGGIVQSSDSNPSNERPSQLAIASCWVVAAYLILKMFYVLGSGGAQPADIALAALALVVVSPQRVLSFMRQHVVYLAFLIWVLVVNTVWSALYVRFDFILSASYYLFNALLLLAVYSIRSRAPEAFDRIVIIGLRASIVVQLVVLFVSGQGRAMGSFNNPNQLAYWAVLVSSIYLLLRRNVTRWSDLPFLLGAAYLCFASLSRAGTLSVAAMLALWFWMALRTPTRRLMGAAVGALLAVAFIQGVDVGQLSSGGSTLSDFESRLERRENENVAEVRNWDRITDYYQYNLLGAGEGYYRRFEESRILAIEIHSSFATLLFSYGIIGLGLFVGFILHVARGIPWSLSVYLLPSLIYGITHQGLRFSFFWLLIGIMCSMGDLAGRAVRHKKGNKREQAEARLPALQSWKPRGPQQLRRG